MTTDETNEPLFQSAVGAIDRGDLPGLANLLERHPELVSKRMDVPAEGYFRHPYLMWFIADNPVRNGILPGNIVAITRLILRVAQQYARDSFSEQVNYTLRLVASGRTARECHAQIALIDLLIDHGATPDNGHDALIHGNTDAAKHMIEKSGVVTLAAACCLDREADIQRLLKKSTKEDKQIALMAASFYGKHEAVSLLLQSGANVNAYIDHGFHSHASPLHQAVASGSFETVKLLVEAGAILHVTDTIYNGTPLGWAIHMSNGNSDEPARAKYEQIVSYLQELS